MHSDTVADLLTRIRNAQRAGHPSVRVELSKENKNILKVLQQEGFIAFIEEADPKTGSKSKFKQLLVGLKYLANGKPVINTIKRVSVPGKRIFVGVEKIKPVHRGLGLALVSTSKGVLSDREAKKAHVGGELLAVVY